MSDTTVEGFEDPSVREAILAIVPKLTGALSFFSSGWIAYNVLSDRSRRAKTYHRLLALMSLCDMVSSFSYMLSTWPIPPGMNLGWKKNSHIWAVGTEGTCTAQAVGIQWGVTSAFLNVVLSVHYLLVIRYHATERCLQNYQPLVVGLALLIGLGLTIPGIVLGIFGNTNLWCWIAPNFATCALEGLSRDECIQQAYHYRWAFYYGPVWGCILLITAVQAALLASVCKVEQRSARWSASHTPRRRQYRTSWMVTEQACWYVGVFYVTWLPYTSIALTGRFFTPDDTFAVLFLVVFFQPLQGFLNLFVYQRQRIFGSCALCWGGSRWLKSGFFSRDLRASSKNSAASPGPGSVHNSTQHSTQECCAASGDAEKSAEASEASESNPLENPPVPPPESAVVDAEAAAKGETDVRENVPENESDKLLEHIYGD